MMDKNQALAKIKKCLALSHSTNEYEVAQALKHAHALMQQYNLGTTDIELADVGEQNIRTTKTLPQWHWDLSLVCAHAFDCRRWKQDRDTGSFFIFCGLNGKQELAAYAYEVLLRQIKSARRSYIKETLNRVRLAKNKTARADAFCTGWVNAVRDTVQRFAANEKEKAILSQYIARHYGEFRNAKVRTVKGTVLPGDYFRGETAGANVRLDVPLEKSGTTLHLDLNNK